MGGFFGLFKSSEKAIETASSVIDKATSGIIEGLDNRKFTEEEKAKYSVQVMGISLDVIKTLANEGTPTAISRRILAFMIIGYYFFLITLAITLYLIGKPDLGKVVVEQGIDRVETMAIAVVTTYFVYHGVSRAVKQWKGGQS